MSVSPEEVEWAYRMLLGREPENEGAVASHADLPDLAALRARFMGSDEFRSNLKGPLAVGRYVDEGPADLQMQCTETERLRMLDRISREWIGFGERDPHWSVLVDDKFFMPNIGAHEDEFYATGAPDVRQVLSMIRRSRPDAAFKSAMDFGCGVGRLSLALASHAEQVVGIDISPPHLVWGRERAERIGVTNVDFRSIASFDDLRVFSGFDLVMSLIVLQHNPPPAMAELLSILLASLSSGGLAVFQVPTYLHGRSFSIDEYFANEQPSMEMNALPQAVVFDIVAAAGCVPLEVREDGRIGDTPGLSHTFLVERRS